MKKIIQFTLICSVFLSFSCTKYLEELNENPNGADPNTVHPNMILTNVLTNIGSNHVSLNFDDIFGGMMQHTQKDGWGSAHNNYDWEGSQSWSHYYGMLRDNELVYNRSVELGYEMHQGISIVIKSMLFGFMTDLWGDVPYDSSLKGALGGAENVYPNFAPQEEVYKGVIAELKVANEVLSKNRSEYSANPDKADVYYGGDPTKWRKLANSLQLRFYMRLSSKLPDFAKQGIEEIMGNQAKYPVIADGKEDALMAFPGTDPNSSWVTNTSFDATGSGYRRIKMGQTLVEKMRSLQDPRLTVWAQKVSIPIEVIDDLENEIDATVDGVRMITTAQLRKIGLRPEDVNTNPDYVGIPSALNIPQAYNLSSQPGTQASNNAHVSWLNPMYMKTTDPLLKARLMTATEVFFILAEAAQKGWAVGANAETYYNMAIQASFVSWGLGAYAEPYLSQPTVAYNGTLKQLIEQKWISSWTAACEAWFDYRRTGYPVLVSGPYAKSTAIPVRFYYMLDEMNLNKDNANEAIARLETTAHSNDDGDGKNSAWSKPWVLQGTGKPW